MKTYRNPFDDDEEDLRTGEVAPIPQKRQSSSVNPVYSPIPNQGQVSTPPAADSGQGHSKKKMQKIMTTVDRKMAKRGVGNEVVCVDEADENRVIRFLISERVFGYPGSDGSWGSNYKYYVFNNHPLLSLFLLHPLNPYTRRNRLVVFICIALFAVTLSFVFWHTDFVTEVSVCREGCHPFTNNSWTNSSSILIHNSTAISNTTIFCTGYNSELSKSQWQKKCKYFQSWMIDAAIGAILVPYGTFVKFVSTCGCTRGREFYQSSVIGSWCSRMVEFWGGLTLSALTALNSALVLWVVYECYMAHISFILFQTFVVSKIWSVVEWFAWSAPYFSYRFPLDRRRFYKKLEAKNKAAGIAMTPLPTKA